MAYDVAVVVVVVVVNVLVIVPIGKPLRGVGGSWGKSPKNTCTRLHTRTHTNTHVRMHTCTDAHMNTNPHAHARMHAYAQAHMHGGVRGRGDERRRGQEPFNHVNAHSHEWAFAFTCSQPYMAVNMLGI